jgi:hypothetical protein
MMSTSAGPVAYDSHGSGDPVVLLPSGGHDHHDYDELIRLASAAFITGSQTSSTRHGGPAAGQEQQQ